MSDDDDLDLLLGETANQLQQHSDESQQQSAAASADDDVGNKKSKKEKKEKSKKEKKSKEDKKSSGKEKKKEKKDKKSSGKRRRRDDDDDDEDNDDIMDWDNIETDSDDDEHAGGAFVADAASSGDDENDDMAADDEEEDDGDTSYLNMAKVQTAFEKMTDQTKSVEEIAREFERHFDEDGIHDADSDADGYGDDEDDMGTSHFTHLPSPDDAKVYAVRIRGGFSKLLVNRLINKAHAYLHANNTSKQVQDLGIYSCFSLPHVPEFIYVEASRQKFVETALAGLDGCFRFRVTELGAQDVLQLFNAPAVTQLGSAVKVGELLRVRMNLYRLDLGEVMEVLEDGRRVKLRLVPRVDFVNKAPPEKVSGGFGHGFFGRKAQPAPAAAAASTNADDALSKNNNSNNTDSNNNNKKQTFADPLAFSDAGLIMSHKNAVTEMRPVQRLFDPALALGVTKGIHGGFNWGTETFDANGYIIKEFTVRQLFVGQAKGTVNDPSPEELRLLFVHSTSELRRHLQNNKPSDAALQFSSDARIVYYSERFKIGDPIKIVKGQLTGVKGRVSTLQPSEGRAVIQTDMGGGQIAEFTVDLSDACKMFEIGDQIAVERGPCKGDTGVVLTADGIHIEFFSDMGKGHCTAEANDCSAAAASAAMPMQLGAWKLFDLVRLIDDRTVGVIVSLGAHTAELLTDANAATRVPVAQIKERLDSRGQRRPTDAFGNQLFPSRELAVEVLAVPGAPKLFAGKVCAVKAVFEETIFVRANDIREHAGIGAVNCKVVRMLSGNKRADKAGVQPQDLLEHTSESRQRAMRNGGGGGGGAAAPTTVNPLSQRINAPPRPMTQSPTVMHGNQQQQQQTSTQMTSALLMGGGGALGISMNDYLAAGSKPNNRGGVGGAAGRGGQRASSTSTQWAPEYARKDAAGARQNQSAFR